MSDKKADSVSSEVLQALGDKLKGFISVLDFNVAVADGVDHRGSAYFNITGADIEEFLTNKAEPIKSLAFLLQTWHDHAYGLTGVDVKVDADGELYHRELELRELASEACATLTEPGKKTELEPLNPYDRRVIHMILGEMEGFDSESMGSGHFKSMIIRRL